MTVNRMVENLYEEFKEQLMAVVVYGSHARGTATLES